MQRTTEFLENDPLDPGNIVGNIGSGALKSGAGLLGNVLDMVSKPRTEPMAEAMAKAQGKPASEAPAPTWMQRHIHDAAEWLRSGGEPEGFWQNVGAVGEQALEYIGTDGILKMAGVAPKLAQAGEVGSKAVQTAEHLKSAQEVAGVLAKHPKLAGLVAVGLKASKDAITSGEAAYTGAMMGGQTYLHTQDPEQAALAALTGGALHVGMTGVAAPLAEIAPKTLNIGGEEVPALASQVNEAGRPVEGGAAEAPKIAQAQQAAAQNIIGNKARQATAAALGELNATRTVGAAPGSSWPPGITIPKGADYPARLLPAPEGSQGFPPFTMEGLATGEDPTGTLVQRAEAVPKTESHAGAAGVSPQQGEIGSLARTVPSRSLERPQAFKTASATGAELAAGESAQSAADQATIEKLGIKKAQGKKLTPAERSELEQATARESTAQATTEPRGETVTGGGQLQTRDPHEATAWLHQLEEIQQRPGYSDLPAERRAHIEDQHKTLQDQLGLYYNSPYAQRFNPIDVQAATSQVNTFGGAAEQIRSAAKGIYERMTAGAKERFNAALDEYYKSRTALRGAAPGAEEDAAQARYDAANKAVDNLIDLHRGAVSGQDYRAAKQAWGTSAKLDELNQVFERMMNDVTDQETKLGYSRKVVTPNAKALQRWLEKGNNMSAMQNLIGEDGFRNLKDITRLLSNAKDARASIEAAGAVRSFLSKKLAKPGMGAAAGAGAAYFMGGNIFLGALAGAEGEEGIRLILRAIAHDPKIGGLFTYAVKNNVAAKIYAPLIARALTTPFEEQAKPEDTTGGEQ
jgi:hypothetical protein